MSDPVVCDRHGLWTRMIAMEALEKCPICQADEITRLRAALAASEVVRAELESRLASWSEDKLRASNLRLTEEGDRLRAALAKAESDAFMFSAGLTEMDIWKERAERAEASLAAVQPAVWPGLQSSYRAP